MTETRALDELLADVTKEGQTLTDFLSSNSYYQPSFAGGFKEYPELPEDVDRARNRLRAAAKAVHDLAAGPKEYLRRHTTCFNDLSTMAYICYFKIPEAVPLVGSVSYEQVAEACEVDESQLRRILRYAFTNHFFRKTSPDEVAHTAYSAILVTDKGERAVVEYECFDAFPAAAKLAHACEKWPGAEEPEQTAWSMANHSERSYFQHLSQPGNEEQAQRFADCMTAKMSAPEWNIKYTLSGYDWNSVKGTVVDIGGSQGQTAIALAREFPHLPQIVVEDLPAVVEPAKQSLPGDLGNRVSFIAHDFHELQPAAVACAQVLVMKFVLHDHSDKAAVGIIRNVLPALKQGATLVVLDVAAPPFGEASVLEEKAIRSLDVEMLTMLNGKERTAEEWKELFQQADQGLKVSNVNLQKGSALGVFEVVYSK